MHSLEEAGDEPAISVSGLVKSFGEVRALDGIDLDVPKGTVLGVLGPNGAGKTTTVRILATLLKPDAGSARVAGLDVVRDAGALRAQIGLAGQYAAVDEHLTGEENLVMVGRLYGMNRNAATTRARELLERFDLTDAAERVAKTYSGGMRRRLDLAAALVANPPVLFLDEPTTGLDPRSRVGLWETIEGLVAEGTTVLLTTQYLDEAERLADRIAVIDRGTRDRRRHRRRAQGPRRRRAPRGPPDRPRGRGAAAEALAPMSSEPPQIDEETVRVPVEQRTGAIMEAVRRLDEAGVGVEDLGVRRPTLDEVFLSLTGHEAVTAQEENGEREEVAA